MRQGSIIKFVEYYLGMTLTLDPRSHSAFSKCSDLIEQLIVGHLGSFFFRMAALHSSVSLTISVVGRGLLLLRTSLRYLA
jgi:hypothetical protein